MTLDYKKILNFLFPPSEDELLISQTSADSFRALLKENKVRDTMTLLPYSNTQVKSAIHLLKFHNHAHARKLLAAVLTHYLHRVAHEQYIIIPIPLSKKRLRERGYNQVTELIKEALDTQTPGQLKQNILIRTRNTTPQTTLSREKRLRNLENAFAIKNFEATKKNITGKHILLIDDVMTTGTTLQVAKAALLPISPASVTCLALAH